MLEIDSPRSNRMHEERRELPGEMGVLSNGWPFYLKQSLTALFWGKLQLLLLFLPIAIIIEYGAPNQGAALACSMIALIPLAAGLGFITEQLALYTNETVGGLLNATFGNATELIISIAALANGDILLVQVSLLGSVLSNLLLVLGSSFIAGGLRTKAQRMNQTVVATNMAMLKVALAGVMLVTIIKASNSMPTNIPPYNIAPYNASAPASDPERHSELAISRGISLLAAFIYALFISFQIKTHKYLYDLVEAPRPDDPPRTKGRLCNCFRPKKPLATDSAGSDYAAQAEENPADVPKELEREDEDEDEDDEEKILGWFGGLFWLTVYTVFIAWMSEVLVGNLEGAAKDWGVPGVFIGVILVPIVGNAAEHTSALTVAYKDKIDLAVGIAVGSAVQISTFVVPLLVIIGWMIDKPMSLDFGIFQTTCLFVAIVAVSMSINDGVANYLKGCVLILIYVFIAICFYYHTDDPLTGA